MINYSDNTDIDTQADSIGDYLPNGPIFAAKRFIGSNLRNLLRGLSGTLYRAQQFMQITVNERDISQAEQTIREWEAAVGIPDQYFLFPERLSLADRQRDVLTKVGRMNSSTASAWEALILLYGFTATVESGWAHRGDFPLGPAGDKEAKFTVIVTFISPVDNPTFPVDFPWEFGSKLSQLQLILFAMKPANVSIQYRSI